MESLSSWAPQPKAQPEPPIAHAPKPIGVMYKSELPSCLVFMVAASFLLFEQNLGTQTGNARFQIHGSNAHEVGSGSSSTSAPARAERKSSPRSSARRHRSVTRSRRLDWSLKAS